MNDNSLIELSKNVINNLEKIDDIVDSYFEGIKDYTDTLSDILTPFKAIGAMYTFTKKIRFKNFMKGYSKALREGSFNLDVERMKRYLKNEKNFSFLNDTIEAAINSKSNYCSLLLGHYAGKILTDNNKINFKDIIIVEVLRELNDYELSCFTRIYSIVAYGEKEVDIDQYTELKAIRFLCELTINKMLNLRVLGKPVSRFDSDGSVRFVSTEIAENIHLLLKDVGIEEDLLRYEL